MHSSKIPKQAKWRILSILREDYRIPTETMLKIIAHHVPFNLNDRQQRAYWLDKCQQLMASIRDTEGRRMVFNIPRHKSINKRSEYIMVGACTDPQELAIIQYRLNGSIVSMYALPFPWTIRCTWQRWRPWRKSQGGSAQSISAIRSQASSSPKMEERIWKNMIWKP